MLGHRGQPGLLPGPAVDPDLDGVDAPVRRPGDPGDGGSARLDLLERPGHVDPRERLDRRAGGVAALRPVRLLAGERGQFQVGDPLGPRDVAVQPGDHHPGREPVRDRERLAVHAHRDHGVRVVDDCGHRGADGHALGRGGQDLVGAAAHPRLAQQPGQAAAQPAGVARQVAAYLIGDAGQRDVGLGQRPAQQVIEGDLQRPADHRRAPAVPTGPGDLRQDDVGVDPVEGGSST